MTKGPRRRTALDKIATQLRTALRGQTKNVIAIGEILVESRKHLEPGDWQAWLSENFDLSIRTAQRYVATAEYTARKSSDTVSDLANISATVLYRLAEGGYDAKQEAAILAAARDGRVDISRADDICEELEPDEDLEELEPEDDLEEFPTPDATREIIETAAAAEEAEIEAILDGPSPLLPPEPSAAPDVMLHVFDQTIATLMQLMSKPATRFAGTAHSSNDLEHVKDFIRAVADRTRSPASAEASSGPIYSTTAASDVNQGEEATQ